MAVIQEQRKEFETRQNHLKMMSGGMHGSHNRPRLAWLTRLWFEAHVQ
jgi:hypothetical protein